MVKSYRPLYEAIICSLALMIFSFFIHYGFPLNLISFASLIIPAWIISRSLMTVNDIKKMFYFPGFLKVTIIFCCIGILLGLTLAIIYRRHLGISIFPRSFHLFVIVAALIGFTEEIVFRGYIQDQVRNVNAPLSILFSTVAHTGYKCCLFLSPAVTPQISIEFIALWTLAGGLLFGIIRHFSKSILPSSVAHVLFDILVYAEYIYAPWWVW